jgi:hypothetical protein
MLPHFANNFWSIGSGEEINKKQPQQAAELLQLHEEPGLFPKDPWQKFVKMHLYTI